MSWAQRLKRVFAIVIEAGARCGGRLRVIASIEEPQVIAKILSHLQKTAAEQVEPGLPLGGAGAAGAIQAALSSPGRASCAGR
jgi:hypothetical protein